jgi:hypothetical protein
MRALANTVSTALKLLAKLPVNRQPWPPGDSRPTRSKLPAFMSGMGRRGKSDGSLGDMFSAGSGGFRVVSGNLVRHWT